MPYRFHLLAVPHTATNRDHSACAYTQKVLKMAKMLVDRGHEVIHYGNEESEVPCDHVTVTSRRDLVKAYGEQNGRIAVYKHNTGDDAYKTYYTNTIRELARRKQPGDFLLFPWNGLRPIADAHKNLIQIESGIGYADGYFAQYKVFESYAILHCYLGLEPVRMSHRVSWNEVVIPNYFDPNDFEYREQKDDFLLHMGRLTVAKGTDIAIKVAEAAGMRLVVAGQKAGAEVPSWVEFVGFADFDTRRDLMARARALICPSMFVEPFCGVSVEAMLSGTPVITTDWGAVTENVLHGVTGYRCRSMQQFVWAVLNADRIKSHDCRMWAEQNFSIARVGDMYEEFWDMVKFAETGRAWDDIPSDIELRGSDWLTRHYPDNPYFAGDREVIS